MDTLTTELWRPRGQQGRKLGSYVWHISCHTARLKYVAKWSKSPSHLPFINPARSPEQRRAIDPIQAESETKHEIVFLDVSVCRQDNGEFNLQIRSSKAVVTSLTNRLNNTNNISTNSGFRSKKLKQETSTVLANGYPKRFIIDSSKPVCSSRSARR